MRGKAVNFVFHIIHNIETKIQIMSSLGYTSTARRRKESLPYGQLLTMLFVEVSISLAERVLEDIPMTRVVKACTLQSLQLLETQSRGYVCYPYLQDTDVKRFAHYPCPEERFLGQTWASRIMVRPPSCAHDGETSTSTTPPPLPPPFDVLPTLITSPSSTPTLTLVPVSPFSGWLESNLLCLLLPTSLWVELSLRSYDSLLKMWKTCTFSFYNDSLCSQKVFL